MLHALCICDLVPSIATRTHLVLILHQIEAGKTTNTGTLAARCLTSSRIVIRGAGNPVDAGALWPDDHDPVLLFPGPGARPITEFVNWPRPIALVVPDGTWGQASRARNRIPALAGVPSALIPPDPLEQDGLEAQQQTLPRLRKPGSPGQRPTIEAIARALQILEGDRGHAVRTQLETIHRIMVVRTLKSRGLTSLPPESGDRSPHPGPDLSKP